MDAAAKALSRFEEDNRYRDFKAFHFEQAVAFKRHLAEQTGQRSGREAEQGDLTCHADPVEAVLSNGWPGSRGTRRAFSIPTPTTSTCRRKTRALPRPSGSGKRRRWSK